MAIWKLISSSNHSDRIAFTEKDHPHFETHKVLSLWSLIYIYICIDDQVIEISAPTHTPYVRIVALCCLPRGATNSARFGAIIMKKKPRGSLPLFPCLRLWASECDSSARISSVFLPTKFNWYPFHIIIFFSRHIQFSEVRCAHSLLFRCWLKNAIRPYVCGIYGHFYCCLNIASYLLYTIGGITFRTAQTFVIYYLVVINVFFLTYLTQWKNLLVWIFLFTTK